LKSTWLQARHLSWAGLLVSLREQMSLIRLMKQEQEQEHWQSWDDLSL
jgi:hypothetical protein